MKYLAYIGLLALLALLVIYATRAKQIRDWVLNWTEREYGVNGIAFRLQKAFTGNAFYVNSFRIVAVIAALCVLAVIVYLVVVDR